MYLHTHTIKDEGTGEDVEVYVLHASHTETSLLTEVLSNALVQNPEAESYAITLGKVEALTESSEVVVPSDVESTETD